MAFTQTEQHLVDELVRSGGKTFYRPPWLQAHRARAIRAEAERRLAPAPAPAPAEKPR